MIKVTVYGANLKMWWLEIISPYTVEQLSIIILTSYHGLNIEMDMMLNVLFKTIQVISRNSCKGTRF